MQTQVPHKQVIAVAQDIGQADPGMAWEGTARGIVLEVACPGGTLVGAFPEGAFPVGTLEVACPV